MSEFRKSCRQCFTEKGQTILLVQDPFTQEWVCPKDQRHKWKEDIIVT